MFSSMVIGITAEWNPFHQGHRTMIQKIKSTYPEASLIAIMSGAFVQRGEPALFDKWTRARWALENGIDAVFEFPSLYALQSADYFSGYAVDMLAALGVSHIAFSTESLSKNNLIEAAQWSISDAYESLLHQFIQDGSTYGEAAHHAMSVVSPFFAKESTQPNNLLGLRYTERICRQKYPIDIIAIHRDMEHNISASDARKDLLSQNDTDLLTHAQREEAKKLMQLGHYTNPLRYEDACHLATRQLSLSDLFATGLFTEGLENKWHKECEKESYNEMLSAIKSKRYLYSSLKRIGAKLLLGHTKGRSPFLTPPPPCYARLLALRREKSCLLRNSPLPIITSTARALKSLPAEATAMLSMDIHAQNIQNWCQNTSFYRKGNVDFYQSPLIL